VYQLGFPNKEVEEGFFDFLVPYYTSVRNSEATFYIMQFVNEVRTGQTEAFLKRLSSFFADTPYELVKDLENHYQNVFFILTKLMGFYVDAERHTSQGRIDLFIRTADYAYVMDFKLDGSAEEALQQIHDKQYALPFAVDQRKLICVGVNFSSQTRNIERWIIEE
jgi:ATP-dependent exoDNAse (exonuclease V) beta subunit